MFIKFRKLVHTRKSVVITKKIKVNFFLQNSLLIFNHICVKFKSTVSIKYIAGL